MVFVHAIIGFALDHQALVLCGELAERRIHRNLARFAELDQVALRIGAHAAAPRSDGALGQRQRPVGKRQVVVNRDDAAEAFAGRARAERMIETKQGRRGFAVFEVALCAMQAVGKQ